MNTGVLLRPIQANNYIAGVYSAVVYKERLKDRQWKVYRPTDEKQIGIYFDTMSCVSFAGDNTIEEQIAYLIDEGILNENNGLKELQEMGFWDENGNFNCSDRFLAIMSGTTKYGNYLEVIWETIRKVGLLPEKDLPNNLDDRTPWTWEDWMNKDVITQEMKDKAKRVLDILQFAYEWVAITPESLKYHLKQAPIQIAAPVCSPWNTTEIIQACPAGAGHSTIIDGYVDKEYWHDFDHYFPYGKKLAWNYPIKAGLKGIVEVKETNLIDKSLMSNSKIIKDADSSAVGIWDPAINESALRSQCANRGIKVPELADGNIDWDKLINGDWKKR